MKDETKQILTNYMKQNTNLNWDRIDVEDLFECVLDSECPMSFFELECNVFSALGINDDEKNCCYDCIYFVSCEIVNKWHKMCNNIIEIEFSKKVLSKKEKDIHKAKSIIV